MPETTAPGTLAGIRVVRAPARVLPADRAAFTAMLLDTLLVARAVVLDCSALTLLDASGMGALVSVANTARRNGRFFAVAALVPELRDLFLIAHLDRAFPVTETVAEALALVPVADRVDAALTQAAPR